jgi:hypothetical protein
MARIVKPSPGGAVPYGSSTDTGSVGFNRFKPSSSQELINSVIDEPVVAFDVLNKFNIPFTAPSGLLGKIPGYDIRVMDPFQAIRLSLAENYKNKELVEVFVDESGIARFVKIGVENFNPAAQPMFRTKTIAPDLQGDLVIVRGFDFPPERRIATNRTFKLLQPGSGPGQGASLSEDQPLIVQAIDPDGATNIEPNLGPSGNISATDTGSVLNKRASIVYHDPALDSAYKDDIFRSYNPRCFESLVAWKHSVDWDIVHAIDPDATVEFSNSSILSVPLDVVNGTDTNDPNAFATYRFASSALAGRIGDILVRENHYGEPLSTFSDINGLIVYGYRVTRITAIAVPNAGTVNITYSQELTSDGNGIFHSLSEGSDYTWEYEEQTIPDGSIQKISPIIKVFNSKSIINDDPTSGHPNVTATVINRFASVGLGNTPDIPLNAVGAYMPVGDGLGYLAGGLFANVTVTAPSVNIFSPLSRAREVAEAMIPDFVELTPIILYDPPAPVYYRFRDIPPDPVGGGPQLLQQEGFIDHAEDLVDADPITTQELDSTPSKQLQDASTGTTIDVSFPFIFDGKITDGLDAECQQFSPPSEGFTGTEDIEETEITTVRDFIFELYNNQTDNPVSETGQFVFSAELIAEGTLPQLGQRYEGGVINSISYSFQDSSSFQITIDTGHIISNIGSWGANIYQRQTEDVSREGVVTQVSGNGALYAVKIWRLGIYSAISSIIDEIEVGDRVSVTVHNNPVESGG